MKILITGGAGFIGSALCRHYLAETDCQVVNLDALTYAADRRSLAELTGHPRHFFVRADLRNPEELANVFRDHQPDGVIHLAAESHVDRSIDGPADFMLTNIMGAFNLLEAGRAYWEKLPGSRRDRFRFLQVSTDEVYGSLGEDGYFTEATPYAPNSPYSASKAAADHLARAWCRTFGFPALITNCSNNYGPRQFPEKLIPLMIINALENRSLPVYGDGLNVRDWLFVEDHARALALVFERGTVGDRYNIGGRNEVKNLEVVETICRLLDRLRPKGASYAEQITFVPDRPGHDRRYAIDAGKVERELGWRPREDFAGGLTRTVNWYLENESWWRELKAEAAQRLGLAKRGGE